MDKNITEFIYLLWRASKIVFTYNFMQYDFDCVS